MMTSLEVRWVPYGKRTLRAINQNLGGPPEVKVGAFAFVGSEIIGSAYAFHPDDNWYGTFFDVRIGSCSDEAMAKANVEHRWKLAREGKNPYGAV